MASLADLPLELVHHILRILGAHVVPSQRYLHEEPSRLLVNSDHQPLKNLSLTCRSLHNFCFPYLFSAMKANVEDLTSFKTRFRYRKHELVDKVESLMIYSIHPQLSANLNRSPGWHIAQTLSDAIVDAINPRCLTFVLPPPAYEGLLPYELDSKDAWAFNIPYQVLRLEQSPHAVQPKSAAKPSSTRNIFTLRPWNHVTFNEGSSIPAYSTYEYFLKKTPSLLVHRGEWVSPITPLSARLTSFDLIALFPMGHLGSTCGFLRSMKGLRRLRTQLAPSVENKIMDDQKALGKCQRSDLWAELEHAYEYLSDDIMVEERRGEYVQLEEWTILDYANTGLREMADNAMRLESWWLHDGEGKWIRRKDLFDINSTIAGHPS